MSKIIGLTGGIASGKSTIAAMLRALGAPVVDADQVAREVVAPGQPALTELVERFGPEILDPRGQLDRPKLAALVFGDPEARAQLNRITHPRIAAASQAHIDEHVAAGAPVVVYEAALIVENRLHRWMDGLIVVSVPPTVQKRRLIDRDGLDEASADARLAAQAPLEVKLAAATWVVDNTGTLERTREQVAAIWAEVKG